MSTGFIEMISKRILPIVALGSFLLLAVAALATLARAEPRNRCQLVPDTWAPSLDQVRNYVIEKSSTEKNASQRLLTQTSQSLADLSDVQLFIIYLQLIQILNMREQKELFQEQKSWLEKRTALARASVTSKGGTLEPLEYSGAFEKITQERLAELQKRLQRQRSTPRDGKEKDKP